MSRAKMGVNQCTPINPMYPNSRCLILLLFRLFNDPTSINMFRRSKVVLIYIRKITDLTKSYPTSNLIFGYLEKATIRCENVYMSGCIVNGKRIVIFFCQH